MSLCMSSQVTRQTSISFGDVQVANKQQDHTRSNQPRAAKAEHEVALLCMYECQVVRAYPYGWMDVRGWSVTLGRREARERLDCIPPSNCVVSRLENLFVCL